MSNSTRTIGADLESPFLDEQIVGPDPASEATGYLESGEDEGSFNEEEEEADSAEEAQSAEEAAVERAEADTAEEPGRGDLESEDEEPEVSEACEEEQASSGQAEWEELEDTVADAAEFESELLESEIWSGTADQLAFRDRVLAAHIARSKASRAAAQRDLRRDELDTIPGTSVEARADTAAAAGRLLAAARVDLAAARKAGHADALRTTGLTATSGYRGAGYQRDLWRRYFSAQGGYYDRTHEARQAIPEGRHSDAAVAYMLKRKTDGGFGLGGRIAAPGYSNHQGGIAVDFAQERTRGHRIANKSDDASRRRWRNTWFHHWLRANAAAHGFAPISTEEWHWEYRPSAASAARAPDGRSPQAPPALDRRGPPLVTPSGEIVRFAQRVLTATEGERLDDDGDLGPLTRAALERFRKRHGLGTTGVIDAKTEIALVQRALEEIAQQSMFAALGVLDAKTRDALTAFKGRRGLAPVPTLDAATRKALTEALAKRVLSSGPRPSGAPTAARPSTTKEGSETVVHVSPTGKVEGLEKGVKVPTTVGFRPDPNDRRDLVIAATGAAEGGFDTVNMYDRGILSWGMMQWTLHQGSLQRALSFIKERLTAQGKSSLWPRLFGGLDLRDNEIVYQGEVVTTKNNGRLREIFRGAATPNEYDRTTAEHWARMFARAGRDPVIQTLQTAYARKEVDDLLDMSLGSALAGIRRRCSKRPKGGTWNYICPKLKEAPQVYLQRYRRVSDYVGTVLKTLALAFGMKVNNPAGTYVHVMLAVDALAATHSTHDIEAWPAGWQRALGDELERVLRASGFAMWGDAKAARAGRVSRTEKILLGLEKQTRTV